MIRNLITVFVDEGAKVLKDDTTAVKPDKKIGRPKKCKTRTDNRQVDCVDEVKADKHVNRNFCNNYF